MFCFCCKLFSTIQITLTTEGNSDWKYLSEILTNHENGKSHLIAHNNWIELEVSLMSETTIDATKQRILNEEVRHWQNVLERLLAIVLFLGQQCLSFRGSSDKLYEQNNGNFLKLVELIAKFEKIY